MKRSEISSSVTLRSVLLFSLVALMLTPWLRNHAYLRDLYDYGLVVAANGHLERGELPYVDYTTPIQAGFLWFNWMAERVGGGTYAGLTRGAAALITLSAALLPVVLTRRLPWLLALIVGGSITAATASQHTILWHNALGAFCLAVVSWSAAIAPVWNRKSWGWHLLTGAALVLGGVNKLNFHLVALAAALAWAIWAVMANQARWIEAGRTALGLLLVGLVTPVFIECLWTGANLNLWWHNVVVLPSEQRLGYVGAIFSTEFLWHPPHEYYGKIWFQPIGLFGVAMTLVTSIAAWRVTKNHARLRVLAAMGTIAAGGAGLALTASNFEITYIGIGAWLVLLVSVWLGTGATALPRKWLLSGMALPALLIGVTALESAWRGQRSQFGYAQDPRSDYVAMTDLGERFTYFKGLRMPPDYVRSFDRLMANLPDPDITGRRPVFWGVGTEWMERFIPAQREPRQPLWIHWGTSYNQTDIERLAQQILARKRFAWVYNTVARDDWPWPIDEILLKYYDREVFVTILFGRKATNPDAVDLSDTMATIQGLGGNVSGRAFFLDRDPFVFMRGHDGLLLYGSARLNAQVKLQAPINRLRGVAVLHRVDKNDNERLFASAKITVHGSIPERVLWQRELVLEPGQDMTKVPFEVEAGGKYMLLWAQHEFEQAGRSFVGYRDLEILHSEELEGPPVLRNDVAPVTETGSNAADSLFGGLDWRPEQIIVRGGRSTPEGIELPAGGEVWFHTDNMAGEVRGRIETAPDSGASLTVRTFWCKGARVQPLQGGGVAPDQDMKIHMWTAELGGWIGVTVEPGKSDSIVRVRIESANFSQ